MNVLEPHPSNRKSARRVADSVVISVMLAIASGCGAILGIGDEQAAPTPDAGGDDAANVDADASNDADGGSASEAGETGPLPVQATYGGGRVLTNVANIVPVLWSNLPDAGVGVATAYLDHLFAMIPGTPYIAPLNQYYAGSDAHRVQISLPSLSVQNPRYVPPGVTDPDAFIDGIPASDTIYVVYYPRSVDLCGNGADGCSGLTPGGLPYIRVVTGNTTPDLPASAAALRELVNVITNSDGKGWTVPYGGARYSLGTVCTPSTQDGHGGAGLGQGLSMRIDRATLYAFGGMFSALSNHGAGACIGSRSDDAVLVATDLAGATRAIALRGNATPPDGVLVPSSDAGFPNTDNITIAGPPHFNNWFALWTMRPSEAGAMTEASLEGHAIAQGFGGTYTYPGASSLPAATPVPTSVDALFQGDDRWDTFVVGRPPAGDAGTARPALFHFYFDPLEWDRTVEWYPLGDGSTKGVTILSGPGATSREPGRVDAFVLAATPTGTHLMQIYCDERDPHTTYFPALGYCSHSESYTWVDSAAPDDGVELVGDPDAASWPPQDHIAIVSAVDGSLRYMHEANGATRTWTTIAPPAGVKFRPNPAIVGLGDQRFLVAAIDQDGAVWQWLYDWGPGTWSKASLPAGQIAIDLGG